MHTIFFRCPFIRGYLCFDFTHEESNSTFIREFLVTKMVRNKNFSLFYNGKELRDGEFIPANSVIHISFVLVGGKGGFGSMLRAIGAQIEKTTNREACRDLSGRRLRDINEEQRLKKWISKKAEREAEKTRRRKERIERLKSRPKHNFVDFEYEKEISELPERIDDALTAGIRKANKRPSELGEPSTSKKKRLWLDDDISGSSDSDQNLGQESPEYLRSGSSSEDSKPGTSKTFNSNKSEACGSSSNSYSSFDQLNEGISVDSVQESTAQIGTSLVDDKKSAVDCNQTDSTLLKTKEAIAIPFDYGSENVTPLDSGSENSTPLQTDSEKTTLLGACSENTTQSTIGSEKENELKDKSSVSKDENHDTPIDLQEFHSVSELQALGLERLKFALMVRGLKCGGNIVDRAQRLWTVKDLEPSQYPKNLLAKQKK